MGALDPNPAIIETHGLAKRYGRTVALADLTMPSQGRCCLAAAIRLRRSAYCRVAAIPTVAASTAVAAERPGPPAHNRAPEAVIGYG